jgi:hypothetical protein
MNAIASWHQAFSICHGACKWHQSSSWVLARPYSILPSCVCDINRDGVTNDRESINPGVNDQVKVPDK